MKRFFKIVGLTLASLLGLIVLLLGIWILYARFSPAPDPYAYASFWPENLTFQQADEIAQDLVAQMTLDEKLGQMSGDLTGLSFYRFVTSFLAFGKIPIVAAGENERLHIPPFTFSDGPRGVVVTEATAFPVAMARGATWNRNLEFRVGDAIGEEMRSAGATYFGGVCLNLLRHPRWGRAQETFGEDPWHVGQMGVSLINGVQRHHVMACAKHYALNSIENSRFKVDVSVDERTLREVYLPHFKRAVDAGVASVMSAYNKVRGDFCGENRYLLTDILRDDWKFEGFVSSDWFNGLHDPVKGVRAGLDVEMPIPQHYRKEEIEPALEAGDVSIAQIDEMVRRIVRTKLLYLTKTDRQSYSADLLASESHQQLARQVAEESIVLLKNENQALPLSTETIRSIAVIGALAEQENTGDRGSSGTHPPHVVTILDGLRQFADGRFSVTFDPGDDVGTAKQAAADADVVLFVVGYTREDEGEFLNLGGNEDPAAKAWGRTGDRPSLSLKPHDQELLLAALPENPNAIVALIGGSAILTHEWDRLTPAILLAWYPGMRGGEALSNILFGNVSPSGKLPLTIPKTESDLPFFQADIDSIRYEYYHGYTKLDKEQIEAAYPFGFGLSYTTFAYSNLRMDKDRMAIDDTVRVSVDVTNTGAVAGREIVQLYVGFEQSSVDRPVKLLRGFHKEEIGPNQTTTVTIPVAIKDLAWYDPEVRQWQIERMTYDVFVGGTSRKDDLLAGTFIVY